MNSVFMKKNIKGKIGYNAVIQTIPKESYIVAQPDKKDKIEIRWRFIHIPIQGKIHKVVEISKNSPFSVREYLNKNSEWVKTEIDPIYDQFVVRQFFYYTNH
ncbi:MAG: hypothetical protein Harvfovirus51_11 [Harvfovirus sp.]|uniref:Uncharacterized protein n=1 Tax=Harvfovirus sp. TaxID=2487768 RepID=A0A3G5A8I5_9VIRU|nr:MAG: hypothetical protein Harvfovirus51_11 [Harvfovirus sp.]